MPFPGSVDHGNGVFRFRLFCCISLAPQEYELQRQLMLKLKCLGVNAAFCLRSDVRSSTLCRSMDCL